jgi:hypothetical protein
MVHFSKHIQYYYQREFRITWLNTEYVSTSDFEYIDLCVGPLYDICDLIEL